MWHSGLKCQKIGASVKASRKRSKTVLALEVRNFGPISVAPKLDKFSLFDDFFPDLADFRELDDFSVFNDFSLFDCPDLDKFSDLDNFLVFDNFSLFDYLNLDEFSDLKDFPDFLAYFTLFSPTSHLLTSPSPSFLLKAGLLLLFLLEADLLPSFLLGAGSSSDLVVFSIEVSGAAILLKL